MQRRTIAYLAGILLITTAVFSNVVSNGFISNWDDRFYLLENPFLDSPSLAMFRQPYMANYHPITMLAYTALYKISGLSPAVFHGASLALHLMCTWLVFSFTLKLIGHRTAAAIAALLFAIHPMHVESVAWASALKDLLLAAFFLGALNVYAVYVRSVQAGSGRAGLLLTSGMLFLLSLLSKPAAVTLPLVLLLMDYFYGRRIAGKALLEKLPFFLLSLAFGAAAVYAQDLAGATGQAPPHSAVHKLFFPFHAIVFYLYRSVAPISLSAMHYYPPVESALPAIYYIAPLVMAGMAYLVYRARTNRVLVFGSLFFLVNLLPVLQVYSVGTAIVAERYTYLPYIGLFLPVAALCRDKKQWRPVFVLTLTILLSVFAFLSWNRNRAWRDGIMLFSDVIAKYPYVGHPYYIRGNGFVQQGDLNAALVDFGHAVQYDPEFAGAHYNRGNCLYALGKTAEALDAFTAAMEYDPTYADAYYNRGLILLNQGDFHGALADNSRALELRPDFSRAWHNRGMCRYRLGDNKGAMEDYDKAIALNPQAVRTLANRGELKMKMNNMAGACADWTTAIGMGDPYAERLYETWCLNQEVGDTIMPGLPLRTPE